jgi:hypothetical protein
MELPGKNFIQYYKGVKGPFIFIVSSYLMIILFLLLSISSATNVSHLVLVIAGWTLLIAGILYSTYSQHQRVVTSLKESGVLNYLDKQGFQLREEKIFFNYNLNFDKHFEGCFIVVTVTKRQRIFWNRYYLDLHGLTDDQLRQLETGFSDKIKLQVYRDSISLTASTDKGQGLNWDWISLLRN